MAHDVFISYPSKNKPIADAICSKLEAHNYRCWIAPRDILPGQAYAPALLDAIDSSKIFILVFSAETNTSPHIMSEVRQAFNNNLIIIPFRIDNILPSRELEYYIGSPHWLDAMTPPLEEHIDELIRVVQLNLGNRGPPKENSVTNETSEKVTPTISYSKDPLSISNKTLNQNNTSITSEKSEIIKKIEIGELKEKAPGANRKKQSILFAGIVGIVALFIIGIYLFNLPVAGNGDTVVVYYTGIYENGTVFDSNFDKDPIIFTIGDGKEIQGFEEAVIGMSVDSIKTVHIPFDKAFGPHLDSKVFVISKSAFSDKVIPEVGEWYTITRITDGTAEQVLVVNVTNDTVTVDENHPLAGQNLIYTIQLSELYKK